MSIKINDYAEFVDETTSDESKHHMALICLLYTSPSPRDNRVSRMPSSA